MKNNLLIISFLIVISMCLETALAQQNDEKPPVFLGAKKAKIIVAQFYGNTDSEVKIPFEKTMAEFLQYAGIAEDSINYDIIVSINVEGHGIGATYKDMGTTRFQLMSGASLKGSIVFENMKGEKFTQTFDERITPPSSMNLYNSSNPFQEAFKQTWAALLKSMYEPLGVAPLIAALKSQDREVRNAAARALGKIKDRRAVEPLIICLKDNGASQDLVEALEIMYDSRSVEVLIPVLKSRDYNCRLLAIRALKAIKDTRAIESLIAALMDEESGIHGEAAYALKDIDPNWRNTEAAKNAAPIFIAALKDDQYTTRVAAANALREIRDSRAVESLIDALRDTERGVVFAAANALGEIKDRRAIQPLIIALKEKGTFYVANALERITGEHFGLDTTEWQEWWDDNKK